MEGTHCGIDKVCSLGKCITTSKEHFGVTNLQRTQTCLFGDQPGFVEYTGKTCKELIVGTHDGRWCYEFASTCCASCEFYKRAFVYPTNCDFGDRKEGCQPADDCEQSDLCCETCAVINDSLKRKNPCIKHWFRQHV